MDHLIPAGAGSGELARANAKPDSPELRGSAASIVRAARRPSPPVPPSGQASASVYPGAVQPDAADRGAPAAQPRHGIERFEPARDGDHRGRRPQVDGPQRRPGTHRRTGAALQGLGVLPGPARTWLPIGSTSPVSGSSASFAQTTAHPALVGDARNRKHLGQRLERRRVWNGFRAILERFSGSAARKRRSEGVWADHRPLAGARGQLAVLEPCTASAIRWRAEPRAHVGSWFVGSAPWKTRAVGPRELIAEAGAIYCAQRGFITIAGRACGNCSSTQDHAAVGEAAGVATHRGPLRCRPRRVLRPP